MFYLINRSSIIEGALDILVDQVKCPKMYDICFYSVCKIKGNVEVNVNQGTCFADDNTKDNVNQGTCFADENVSGNVNVNDNQGTCFEDGNGTDNVNVNNNVNGKVDTKDNVNVNVNDNVNGFYAQPKADDNGNDNSSQKTCFAIGNGNGETCPETHSDNGVASRSRFTDG